MEALQKLKEQLGRHEGLELKPYRCTANKLTIGFGRNLEDVGISEKEAYFMLQNDIDEKFMELTKRCPAFNRLVEIGEYVRAAVLVNIAFNLGVSGLLKFRKTLRFIEIDDYNSASVEMLDSKWSTQVKGRANELSEQMRTGEWQK